MMKGNVSADVAHGPVSPRRGSTCLKSQDFLPLYDKSPVVSTPRKNKVAGRYVEAPKETLESLTVFDNYDVSSNSGPAAKIYEAPSSPVKQSKPSVVQYTSAPRHRVCLKSQDFLPLTSPSRTWSPKTNVSEKSPTGVTDLMGPSSISIGSLEGNNHAEVESLGLVEFREDEGSVVEVEEVVEEEETVYSEETAIEEDDDEEFIREAPAVISSLRPGLIRGLSFDKDTDEECAQMSYRDGRRSVEYDEEDSNREAPTVISSLRPGLVRGLSFEERASEDSEQQVARRGKRPDQHELTLGAEECSFKGLKHTGIDPRQKKNFEWEKPSWAKQSGLKPACPLNNTLAKEEKLAFEVQPDKEYIKEAPVVRQNLRPALIRGLSIEDNIADPVASQGRRGGKKQGKETQVQNESKPTHAKRPTTVRGASFDDEAIVCDSRMDASKLEKMSAKYIVAKQASERHPERCCCNVCYRPGKFVAK